MLLSLLWITAAVALPQVARAQSSTTLAKTAEATGRYFGTAIAGYRLTDTAYTAIAAREFDMATPENELKFDATEPTQNGFVFTSGDRVVQWAADQKMRVRGSPLVWHSGLPSWTGALSGTALRAAMLNHVTKVAAHYQGKIAYWDVVGEAFNEDGSRRQSSFQRTGNDWIEAAFFAARAADPSAKLCYNDYNIESWTYAKTQGVYAMVADFKARGVPIDCIGLEAHFTGGASVPSSLQTTITSFASLGVEVALTEVDVTNANSTQYGALTQACTAVRACVGITVWGVRDSDSWRSSESPLLFDASGNKKAAYQAVINGFGACCVVPVVLTVARAGTGTGTVASDPAGISCGEDCAGTYLSGSTVVLTATADAGSTFVGWSGPCLSAVGARCLVSLTGDLTVTATFAADPATTHVLTVDLLGKGQGYVSIPAAGAACSSSGSGTRCTYTLPSGTAVALNAVQGSDATFAGWGGDCSGTGSECVVTMDGDRSVAATFELRPRTVTVVKTGTGSGTVTIDGGCASPCSVPDGATVTLVATADAGSTFDGMTFQTGSTQDGDWYSCSGNTCRVRVVGSSVTATVKFTAITTPCAKPVDFAGSTGSFGTIGPVCYRTKLAVRGWGCSSFTGRTVSVNGGTPTRSCGAGPLPLAKAADGYTYFSISAGQYPWATLYAWTW